MFTKIQILTFALISVLAPVKPIVYIAILAIILDTAFGIWRSVKKNGWASIRSRRLSHTISKSLLYSGAITFIFLLEKYVIADVLGHFIAVDLVLTKMFTFFCVVVELKSVNESYEDVTGVDVWTKFKSFVKRSKEQLEDLK